MIKTNELEPKYLEVLTNDLKQKIYFVHEDFRKVNFDINFFSNELLENFILSGTEVLEKEMKDTSDEEAKEKIKDKILVATIALVHIFPPSEAKDELVETIKMQTKVIECIRGLQTLQFTKY